MLREGFGLNADMSPLSMGVAFAFAAVIGFVFGVWPARRAAVLDRIVALRYE